MKRRRVKITGIGPVTPAGIGRNAFWQGILEPISRVRPYTLLNKEFGQFVAAYIDDFEIDKVITPLEAPKGASRQSLFAIAGAVLALNDAGLSLEELRGMRSAVVAGSSIMDFGGILKSVDAVSSGGSRHARARSIYNIGIGCVSSSISSILGLHGGTLSVSNQCNAGMDAIAQAVSIVETGGADVAICGGSEAPLHRFPMLELRAAEMTSSTTDLAQQQARPFDLWRTTGVIAEGCAMFVIEPDSSSRNGYSYISGYGFHSDENNDICGGMVSSSRLAMAQANCRISDVDAINAWGPGDKYVDKGEAKAMDSLFGSRLPELGAVSIKGAIGSPLGATPAIQVAVSALGQRFGALPPTVNWEFPDPSCRLSLSSRARNIAHRTTLINTHGFGGTNAAMILERC